MGIIDLDETYIFKISIKMQFFWCSLFVSKFPFLEFRLLLSRVTPYYSSFHRTVWITKLQFSTELEVGGCKTLVGYHHKSSKFLQCFLLKLQSCFLLSSPPKKTLYMATVCKWKNIIDLWTETNETFTSMTWKLGIVEVYHSSAPLSSRYHSFR